MMLALASVVLAAFKDIGYVSKTHTSRSPKLPRYFVEAPLEDNYCNEAYPLISDKLGLIFCGAPKAATSTWRALLNKHQRGEDGGSMCVIDKPGMKTSPLRSVEIYSAMDTGRALRDLEVKWGNYYTVAMVRNPIERLLSAYLMFHDESEDHTSLEYARKFHNFMIRNILTTTTKLSDPEMEDFQKPMTMSPCAGDAMANISPFWQHFYPQHCRCGLERGVKYTLIGKVENTDDVIDTIADANVLQWELLNEQIGVKQNEGSAKASTILFKLFSIDLFDATVRVRADEVKQLNYTDEVALLRTRLVTFHDQQPGLAKSLKAIFKQESSSSLDKKTRISLRGKVKEAQASERLL
jgi:hypothetical protein